ncbi:MAG: hypothetical protein V4760_01360 [Bdellovibrionota bacterium]
MPAFANKILFIAMALTTTGCATMGGWTQNVKVATDADKAKVSMEGRALGEAPGFFKIRRASSRKLLVTADGQSKDLVVEGRYRWRDSFFANLFAALLSPYAAAAGLGIDFLTGAAWRYDKPPKIYFHKGEPSRPLLPKSIAVAPPRYGDEIASDEIAEELYLLLRQRFPHVRIIAHDKLVATYMSYETDNENLVPLEHRDDLYRELGTTHMAFARVRDQGTDLAVDVRIVDILRDEVVDRFVAGVARRGLRTSSAPGWWSSARGPLVKLIPNSIGLQSSSGGFWRKDWGSPLLLTDPYEFRRTNSLGSFNTNVSLTSSNVLYLKTRPNFAFRARLVPLATLRNDKYETYDVPEVYTQNKSQWTLLQLGFGIGPELGVETPLGYFYFNAVPQITNYWVQGPLEYGAWKVAYNFEFGYTFFLSDRISARLAARAHIYPPEIFEPMIRYQSPKAQIPNSATEYLDTTSLFSIEYVFPEMRKKVVRVIE